jgi:Ca2+-binding EF-hand superfamily protein
MPILANAYRVLNSNFNPQKEDVNSFFDVLDVDKNKKVTVEDLEQLCIRYLTGTTIGVPYRFNDPRSN